jgi:segregation and condensation protein B
VDCGGVIHTLLEKKLVVTAGRKNVVGRPILYRTSRDFLVHFGLKDVGDLPSLREFEEMARQALGADLLLPGEQAEESSPAAPAAEAPSVVEGSPDSAAGTSVPAGTSELGDLPNQEPEA